MYRPLTTEQLIVWNASYPAGCSPTGCFPLSVLPISLIFLYFKLIKMARQVGRWYIDNNTEEIIMLWNSPCFPTWYSSRGQCPYLLSQTKWQNLLTGLLKEYTEQIWCRSSSLLTSERHSALEEHSSDSILQLCKQLWQHIENSPINLIIFQQLL